MKISKHVPLQSACPMCLHMHAISMISQPGWVSNTKSVGRSSPVWCSLELPSHRPYCCKQCHERLEFQSVIDMLQSRTNRTNIQHQLLRNPHANEGLKHRRDIRSLERHYKTAKTHQGEECSPSGYCNPTRCDRPQAACPRR